MASTAATAVATALHDTAAAIGPSSVLVNRATATPISPSAVASPSTNTAVGSAANGLPAWRPAVHPADVQTSIERGPTRADRPSSRTRYS